MLFTLLQILLMFSLGQAQNPLPGEKLNSRVQQREGELVSIRVELGKPVKILVVGREEAKLDLKNMKLTVRRLTPYPEETFIIDPQNQVLPVSKGLDGSEPVDLDVTATVHGKSETLHFKFRNELK